MAASELPEPSDLLSIHINNFTIRATGWADVPEDLLHLLVNRMVGITAYVRFGSVCRFWRSVASANKCCKYVPWLMLSEKEDTDLREFYDLSTNEVFQVPLPEARGRKILGSAHGWLITVGEDGQFNILNPLNRLQIALPPQSSFQSVKEHPLKLTPQEVRDMFPLRATLAPDPASGDFIAMVVHLGFDTTCLSFCRSSDNGWTRFETLGVDAVLDFADGHFYSTNMGGEIFHNEVSPTPKMELVGLHPTEITGSYYVVECDGEILVVSRIRWVDGPTGEPWDGTNHSTDTFKVHKLNLKDKLLTEISSIGDNALFVGFNSTLCLAATADIKAYKKNCIYFTDDYHDGIFGDIQGIGGLDMGVFNLDDGTVEPHYPGVSKSNFSLPIWFIPNPCNGSFFF